MRRRHDTDEHGRHAAREPGHKDPLRGFAGAPPARSALKLRMVLAWLGLVTSAVGAVAFAVVGVPVALVVAAALLALVAAVDIAVIVRRMQQEKRGSWHRTSDMT